MNSSIDSLNMWGARFLDFAVPMWWQSSLLIAAVFTLDFLFRRKIRAAIRYSFWFVVFVKLVVPPTLALPTGAAWWLRGRPVPATPSQHRIMAVHYSDVASDYVPLVAQSTYVAPPAPKLSREGWVLILAMAVSGLLAVWLILRWRHVAGCVRGTTAASEEISEMLAQARRQAGMRRSVALRVTSEAMSPAVCGLFKPVILLPRSLIDKLTANQLRAVLLHELIHLRRQDVWVNCAQTLLQILYWWHPLLWFANARVRRVREEAVDDAVMCALSEDAEVYAPTLLEVAKLAFGRPLASLGLVGILESRNALRHRIERLLNFATPRRAGVSVGSVICLAAFTALAVPMGEPPAQPSQTANISDGSDLGSEKLIPYHANVNSEVFIRNVKARAGETMHTTNDALNDILVSIMDGFGVDCTGERAIHFDRYAGKITTQNTSEALGVLDEVVKELNLAGGERILNPPHGLKQVLIEAQFYLLGPEDAKAFEWYKVHEAIGLSTWMELSSSSLMKDKSLLRQKGINPISSPRIQTSHGITASLSVGDGTNDIQLECVPYVHGDKIDITALARTTGKYAPDGTGWPSFAGHTNCAVFSRISVTNGNSVGLFAARGGYTDKDSLFILLTARVVAPSAKPNGSTGTSSGLKKASDPAVLLSDGKILFQQGKMDEAERKLQEVLVREPNNQAALYYLSLIKQARAQVDQNIPSLARNVPGPEGAPANERSESPRQKISQKLNDITFDKVSYANSTLVEVIRNLTEQATRWDPDREGINFLLNRNQFGPDFDPRTGQPRSPASDVDLTSVKVNVDRRNVRLVDVLDAIVKSADHPIKYSIFDYGVEFSFHDTNAVELHTRTFRVDMEKFFEKYPVVASPYGTNSETTAIQITVIKFFNDVGVNLAAPKSVFFNDRQGTLTVRATDEDLERIQSALDAGKLSLPRVFAGADAAGFSAFTRTFKVDVNTFFLELEKRGVISPQTNAIVSTAATPSGQRSIRGIVTDSDQSTFRVNVQNGLLTYFRGQGVDLQAPKSIFYNDRQSTLTIRATKEDLDTIEQLLNVLNTPTPQVTVKARFVEVDEELLKTLLASGFAASTNRTQDRILTEEQLRPILRGLNLIHEGEVTTLSGRQANFQVVDVQDVLFFGTNKTAMLPIKTNAMPFGTFLDVIPVVAVDGYAIQLKVIPSVTEFLGYQAYAANTTPMAKIRRRTTTMDAIIQDGSTLMVGDLGDEWVVTKPDGTVARHPFDADHGKPMVVFVTATIIDAAGNRVHGDNANAGTKSMPARTISYETK